VLGALLLALFLVQVPAVQGGIVGGLIGLISSQVALFVARYLRERGEVDFDAKGWVRSVRTTFPEDDISKADDLDLDVVTEERHIAVRVHNPKDVSVSLWDFSVTFSKGGRQVLALIPYDTESTYRLDLLNVPAQEGVSRWVRVSVSQSAKQLRQVYEADKVEIHVTVAGEGQLSEELPSWSAPDIGPETTAEQAQ